MTSPIVNCCWPWPCNGNEPRGLNPSNSYKDEDEKELSNIEFETLFNSITENALKENAEILRRANQEFIKLGRGIARKEIDLKNKKKMLKMLNED